MKEIMFEEFASKLHENFKKMSKDVDTLFELDVDKDKMWEKYLESFPNGTNKIFRLRREYDCSCCRHFIKNIGAVVAIKNNKIYNIWDFKTGDEKFQAVADGMNEYLKSKKVKDVYLNDSKIVGCSSNTEKCEDGSIITWKHFHTTLPDIFVVSSRSCIPDEKAKIRDVRNVFKRSLDEISNDSIQTVLELICSNTLYRGQEWKSVLKTFIKYKKDYEKLSAKEKENFAWENAKSAGNVVGKIRNHSIGTLLVNITEGMDLDTAVSKYEAIVAPSNYKRPKAIFTKKMLEDAKNTIEELGYSDSLGRRYAKVDDITVNNILFANKDIVKRISNESDIFDEMLSDAKVIPKKFSKVEEINIEDFINNVLPNCKTVEAYLENKHAKNMVSLIAPKNKDSKTMFKWNNNFSWAYAGNMADSDIKYNVKNAGGKVDGVLRFSIQWNDGKDDFNDLDAHCVEPKGNEIFYMNKRNTITGGNLDVDIVNPSVGVPAVENITWSEIDQMGIGKYSFFVHCYRNNGGKSGFKAEIEFNGEIYRYEYNHPLRQNEEVNVANVFLDKNQNFTIHEYMDSDKQSKDIWNVSTNSFIPVSVIMYSPNYWDEQNGIGNKHYMFMLKDCINPENPNGMFNEYLKEELMKHKRVFEALGSKLSVSSDNEQLSGIGFSSTQRNELVVKVTGNTQRVMKIKF